MVIVEIQQAGHGAAASRTLGFHCGASRTLPMGGHPISGTPTFCVVAHTFADDDLVRG